jgi:anhydro-N-acetylmuramic acid kinase
MIVAGIMSGTSLDGIDAAVVEVRGRNVKTLGFRTVAYPREVRAQLLAVSNAVCQTGDISRLNFQLPKLYARALEPLLKKFRVKLIGCHGQTIYHGAGDRPPNTLQIGDGSVLAELTGIPVVSDFRPRDMAVGGQGAPLVPFVDYRLFRHRTRERVAVNIGGIANLTVIGPSAEPEDVVAFDTGPGNMVIDTLVREFTKGKQLFDRGGRIAARGHLDRGLLEELMRDPYYRASPPKSAGREQYGATFVDRLKASGRSYEDLIATATALTASTIAQAIVRHRAMRGMPHDVIVSGGGAHNPQIMGMLAALLPGSRVATSAEHGIDPDAKEAIAFAILAHETWHGRPGNLPSATGAQRAVILGKISPAAKVR